MPGTPEKHIVSILEKDSKMYKTKNTQKPRSYWQQLVREVTTGNHRTSHPVSAPVQKMFYIPNYDRRATKYTLGEPHASVYFTQREAECIMQLMQGKTMNQVGDSLKLSPRTVEYYLTKIKRKLNCRKKRDVIDLVSQTDFIKIFENDPYNQK